MQEIQNILNAAAPNPNNATVTEEADDIMKLLQDVLQARVSTFANIPNTARNQIRVEFISLLDAATFQSNDLKNHFRLLASNKFVLAFTPDPKKTKQ
jgi:hypothetical protein